MPMYGASVSQGHRIISQRVLTKRLADLRPRYAHCEDIEYTQSKRNVNRARGRDTAVQTQT